MESVQPPSPRASDVIITDELMRRGGAMPDYLREKKAIEELVERLMDRPSELVPRLVGLALELCQASSAGVSILEGDRFRWLELRGVLAVFEGETTPRNFSPCGVCLDQNQAVLMERPERVYGWIAGAGISVPEVLLVPLMMKDAAPLGTLWIVAHENQKFDRGHARVMSELADFTGRALRTVLADERLKKAYDAQETLAREMSHRVKNFFGVIEGMIRTSARSSRTKQELVDSLLARVQALAAANALVRRAFSDAAPEEKKVDIGDVLAAVLRPYHEPVLSGPSVPLGERAINNIALVFHELATNAAKYGSLTTDTGRVAVNWRLEEGVIALTWTETGGPATTKPARKGFGSALVENTVASHGGTIAQDWTNTGLVVHLRLPLEAVSP
ncbi:MAG: GAF domain-containing protein [Hyphomicrobiales bacterium]|nr:GAF domain-containing protein [Hyphomicrobiales bacterium]